MRLPASGAYSPWPVARFRAISLRIRPSWAAPGIVQNGMSYRSRAGLDCRTVLCAWRGTASSPTKAPRPSSRPCFSSEVVAASIRWCRSLSICRSRSAVAVPECATAGQEWSPAGSEPPSQGRPSTVAVASMTALRHRRRDLGIRSRCASRSSSHSASARRVVRTLPAFGSSRAAW